MQRVIAAVAVLFLVGCATTKLTSAGAKMFEASSGVPMPSLECKLVGRVEGEDYTPIGVRNQLLNKAAVMRGSAIANAIYGGNDYWSFGSAEVWWCPPAASGTRPAPPPAPVAAPDAGAN